MFRNRLSELRDAASLKEGLLSSSSKAAQPPHHLLSQTSAAPNARTASQEILPTAANKFATTIALALVSRTAKHRAQYPSVFLMLRNVAGQQIRSYHIIGTGRCRNDGAHIADNAFMIANEIGNHTGGSLRRRQIRHPPLQLWWRPSLRFYRMQRPCPTIDGHTGRYW